MPCSWGTESSWNFFETGPWSYYRILYTSFCLCAPIKCLSTPYCRINKMVVWSCVVFIRNYMIDNAWQFNDMRLSSLMRMPWMRDAGPTNFIQWIYLYIRHRWCIFALTLQNDPPWYLSAAKYAMLIFCITTGTSELLLITSLDY